MKKLFKKKSNLFDASKYISATELAKFFNIEPRELNQILSQLMWIKKEHYIWWLATDLGKKNGAVQYNNKISRIRYVYWEKEIIQNKELIEAINGNAKKQENSNKYEEFIKNYFIQQGHTVWHYSKEEQSNDKNKNITFVAKNKKQILLIHCRDNQLDISLDELKTFQAHRDQFKKENPVFKTYNVTLHYAMSGFFLTEDAYEYIETQDDDITYEIIKGENENHWLDSLLLDANR